MNWSNLVILVVLFKLGDNACSKQKREEPRGYSGEDYIVGGNDALSNSYPWMVYLLIGGKQQCGGSLVSRHVVLTAAHCTDKNEDIKAYIGSNIKKEGQEYIVSLKLNHPGFDRNKKVHYASYDISLLYIKEKVLTAFPITLINPEFQLTPGTTVKALGWGRIAYNVKGGSKLLQEVDLIVSPCTISEKQLVTDTAFCTKTPNKDTCSGDSGSPVVFFENGKYYQVGLTSIGQAKCAVDQNSLYTDLRILGKWVRDNLQFGNPVQGLVPQPKVPQVTGLTKPYNPPKPIKPLNPLRPVKPLEPIRSILPTQPIIPLPVGPKKPLPSHQTNKLRSAARPNKKNKVVFKKNGQLFAAYV